MYDYNIFSLQERHQNHKKLQDLKQIHRLKKKRKTYHGLAALRLI